MHSVMSFLDTMGVMDCVPADVGPKVLRMTLISAGSVKQRSNFYLEAWSEPSDGYPKNSRAHRPPLGGGSSGSTLDLGCEQLEIDWLGTEQEIVVHAVEHSSSMQSKDLPFAEVRIPRSAIERYAREAAANEAHMQCGARTFDLVAIEKEHAIKRKLRFQDMILPGGILTSLVAKVGAEHGLHVPTPKEIEKLRQENEKLKAHNTQLKIYTSGGHHGSDDCGSCMPCSAKKELRMRVTIRFELVPRRSSDLGMASLVRQASFQETR